MIDEMNTVEKHYIEYRCLDGGCEKSFFTSHPKFVCCCPHCGSGNIGVCIGVENLEFGRVVSGTNLEKAVNLLSLQITELLQELDSIPPNPTLEKFLKIVDDSLHVMLCMVR